MDFTPVNVTFGAVAPLVGSGVGLGYFGWKRRQREAAAAAAAEQARRLLEEQRQMTLPEGAAYTYTEREEVQLRQELVGFYMLVAIGTYGLHQVERILHLLALCGLEDLVNVVLIIENDAQLRKIFMHRIPPVFRDCVVEGYSEAFGGGMGNRPPEWVLNNIHLWGGRIRTAALEAVDKQMRGINGKRGRTPGMIPVFKSLGGQPAVGLPALDVLQEKFGEVVTIGFTALPSDEQLRVNFSLLKGEYEQRGVYGWCLQDNLEPDPVTLDTGMVSLLVGLAEAALHGDQSIQPNNVFMRALGKKPGNVLIYRMYTDDVVSFPPKEGQQRFYVYRQQVVESISKGLAHIVDGKGLVSASLPVGELKTSTFDIVLTSLEPDAMQVIKDEVVLGLQLSAQYHAAGHNGKTAAGSGMLFGKKNYDLIFSSLATVVNPQKPICPVMVLRLQAVRNGARMTNQIVAVPDERSVATPSPLAQPLATAPHANGHQPHSQVTKEYR